MRIISNAALTDFASIHPLAGEPMQAWRKIVESRDFVNFADIKTAFNAADKVGLFYVFDISGNKYRVVTAVHLTNKPCTSGMFLRTRSTTNGSPH